jgi:hypothetical protein
MLFFLNSLFGSSTAHCRFVPALLSALIPVLFTIFFAWSGFSLISSLFVGLLVSVNASFSSDSRLFVPEPFFELFSAIAFLAWLRNRNSLSYLSKLFEAVTASLALAMNSLGFVLFAHILIAEMRARTFRKYCDRIHLLLITGVVVLWCSLLLHLTIVSGSSDVLPFRTRLWNAMASIVTGHGGEWNHLQRYNPVVAMCAIGGVALAIWRREYAFVVAPGLMVAALLSLRSFAGQKIRIAEFFGLFSFVRELDRVERDIRSWAIAAVILVGLLSRFGLEMGEAGVSDTLSAVRFL